MFQIIKEIAAKLEIPTEIDVIENKWHNSPPSAGRSGEKKEKNLPKNPYKLLKTSGVKMSTFSSSTMFMKTNDLHGPFHDVDENKASYVF